MSLLELKGVSIRFGGVQAVKDTLIGFSDASTPVISISLPAPVSPVQPGNPAPVSAPAAPAAGSGGTSSGSVGGPELTGGLALLMLLGLLALAGKRAYDVLNVRIPSSLAQYVPVSPA